MFNMFTVDNLTNLRAFTRHVGCFQKGPQSDILLSNSLTDERIGRMTVTKLR